MTSTISGNIWRMTRKCSSVTPGALDAMTKEMIYLAVSVTNGSGYCIANHGAAARKAGMTEQMFGELMAVVGMALSRPNPPLTHDGNGAFGCRTISRTPAHCHSGS
jgi:AhpD family alkylhydroperoxidase